MSEEFFHAHFGESSDAWLAAMEALHAFAQSRGALAGSNVITFFDAETTAYNEALQAARKAFKPPPTREETP